MRTFETGATRDSDSEKYDYEGFLSPAVLERFAEYMHKHRQQADGKLRDSDNWQKGIPLVAYMKSMFRHFMDLWKLHRGLPVGPGVDAEDTCCAMLFNVQGYLLETLKAKEPADERCKLKYFEGEALCGSDECESGKAVCVESGRCLYE